MFLLKLALLNIGRNRKRSFVTLLAVGVGLASLIFLWAFFDGSQNQQRENVIRLLTGHVQIHAAGFEKKLSPELTIPDRKKVLDYLSHHPLVKQVSERVKLQGLVGTSKNSRGVMIVGLDLVRESRVTEIHQYVDEGKFLVKGENRQVLIGEKLAEILEVEEGSKVVIMTQAMDGTLAGFAYKIKGMVHSGTRALDESMVFMSIEAAQELLGIGSETNEIIIRLQNKEVIPAFLSDFQKKFLEPPYEALSWNVIAPVIEQFARYSDSITGTAMIAVMVVIAVGIMNTILMSIFERTKEIGVMLAVGTSPMRIVLLIFLETLILTILGILLGILLSVFLVIYFGHVGIPLVGFKDAFAESFMSNVIYPIIRIKRLLSCVSMLLGISAVIGLYPAWKASRMEPVKAIYHSY